MTVSSVGVKEISIFQPRSVAPPPQRQGSSVSGEDTLSLSLSVPPTPADRTREALQKNLIEKGSSPADQQLGRLVDQVI